MQPSPLNAEELLDQEFLVVRAKILEIAAALDRLDRGAGDSDDHPRNDPRTEKLRSGLGARDLSRWQAEFRLERALRDYISQKNGLR